VANDASGDGEQTLDAALAPRHFQPSISLNKRHLFHLHGGANACYGLFFSYSSLYHVPI